MTSKNLASKYSNPKYRAGTPVRSQAFFGAKESDLDDFS
jgi:hypothetical protein